MSKDMCPGNRPKSNTESRLTPNGRGPAGERPGSAPERNAAGSARASRAGVRRFFAPGTAASAAAEPGGSGGPPADVAELAATLGRSDGAAGVEVAAAAPTAGVDTEASSRPGTVAAGPDVEPDAQPRVDVPAAVARATPSTPPPAGTATTWR